MLRVALLGKFKIDIEDKSVAGIPQPALLLLAYLLLNRGQSHRRVKLAGTLWPDSLESTARKNLRNAIWQLRKNIPEGYIQAEKSTVAFDSSFPHYFDVEVLELAAAATDIEDLIRGASAYQGELMPGFYEDWVQLERERLRSQYDHLMQELLDRLGSEEQWSELFVWADTWIAQGTVPEPAYRSLMLAYIAKSDIAGAASTYERCVEALKQELGVEPSAETRLIYEQMIKDQKVDDPELYPKVIQLEPAGRYVQETLLAIGGQGEVYLGRDLISGERVVIKRLRQELISQDPAFLDRFLREGETLSHLNHPNIVRMLDVFEDEGQQQIVMDYVSGGSLGDLLDSEGQMPIGRVLDITLELADALSRAHHLGIIHRDIKPDNILLAEDGTPRLTDFGLAKVDNADSNLTQVGSIIGSPAYMSPEGLRGEMMDARSDIWSFGALIFEMLTGRSPFIADQISTTMARILTEPTPDLTARCPECPPSLVTLLDRMLAKDREQRISSMRQVAAELERIRSGQESGVGWLGGERAVAPSDTKLPPKTELPLPATPFVGREKELADLEQLILDAPGNRLVTIVGPGGIGKSRLALEAAAASIKDFPDGTYFVRLAPLTSVDHIVSAIGESIDFRFYGSDEPQQQLIEYLSRKKMLLVMDNFEHLLKGAALVADILRIASGIKIVITSRERLHLSGEAVYHLGGLNYPKNDRELEGSADFGAVKLFNHHARLIRPDLAWDSDQTKEMGRVCRLVQGMPLAVVLAAGWLELLTIAEIAEEISQSLDILESEARDLPERQRSVRAVFDYSWSLLDFEDQEVFMKLSVFRGGFSRTAAQQVCGANLRQLRHLAEKSLIAGTGTNSYEIHELLRQFIEEKLELSDAAEGTRSNHSVYYLKATEAREIDLKGRRQLAALNEIENDIENVRAAWYLAISKEHWVDINSSIESLYLFFDMRSRFQEGVELCQAALSRSKLGHNELLWGRIKARECWLLSRYSTNVSEIGDAAESSLALAREHESQEDIAFSLYVIGYYHSKVLSNFKLAITYFRDSLEQYDQLGDLFYLSRNYIRMGYCYGATEGLVDFLDLTRKGLDLALESGNKVEAAAALINLGSGGFGLGDYNHVESYLKKGIATAEEIGDRISLGHGPMLLGLYYLLHGEFDLGYHEASRGLAIADEINFKVTIGYALAVLSAHASLTGNPVLGLELGHRSKATPTNPFGETIGDWALACTQCVLENYEQARAHIYRLISASLEHDWFGEIIWSLPLLALVAAADGQNQRAAQLLSMGVNHPLSSRGWIDKWEVMVILRARLEKTLVDGEFQKNWELGKSLELEATAIGILDEYQP